jgi:hypothetical protein
MFSQKFDEEFTTTVPAEECIRRLGLMQALRKCKPEEELHFPRKVFWRPRPVYGIRLRAVDWVYLSGMFEPVTAGNLFKLSYGLIQVVSPLHALLISGVSILFAGLLYGFTILRSAWLILFLLLWFNGINDIFYCIERKKVKQLAGEFQQVMQSAVFDESKYSVARDADRQASLPLIALVLIVVICVLSIFAGGIFR